MPLATFEDWPNEEQVQALLRGAGLLDEELTDEQEEYNWDAVIAATVADFEKACRRSPFLARTTETPVRVPVERPSRIVALPFPFMEITSVAFVPMGTESPGEPSPLTLGSHYDPEPLSAPAMGKPFTSLTLYAPFTRRERMILTITGRLGYCDEIPADVYQAILEASAARAAEALSSGENEEGITKWEIGPLKETVSDDPLGKFISRAKARFVSVAKAHRKIGIS